MESVIGRWISGHYGASAQIYTKVEPLLRGMITGYVQESWKALNSQTTPFRTPYVYVIDTAYGRAQSLTRGAKEFVIVDVRLLMHFSFLTQLTLFDKYSSAEHPSPVYTWVLGTIQAEKLYCLNRYDEAAMLIEGIGHPGGRFSFDRGVIEYSWQQMRFVLAHELSHTMMRTSPEFRQGALWAVETLLREIDLAGEVTTNSPEKATEEVNAWRRLYTSQREARGQDGVDQFPIEESEEHARGVAENLRMFVDPTWLEEVACDIQAAIVMMAQADGSVDAVIVTVMLALQNLRVADHLEAVAGLELNYFLDPISNSEFHSRGIGRRISESKYRRYVVCALMIRDDWARFDANEVGGTEMTRGAAPHDEERARLVDTINRSWYTNMLAPLLSEYPANAWSARNLASQERSERISDLLESPRKLLARINSGFGTYSYLGDEV